jgi:hypothetical protein
MLIINMLRELKSLARRKLYSSLFLNSKFKK